MTWSFTPDRPIYLQIQEELKLSIVSGSYPPGEKLPAVRDLALEAAVNPNTVQRALTELERDGLVYAQRTSGRFVTEDTEVIEKTKNDLAMDLVGAFLEKMAAIGYGRTETAALINGFSAHKAMMAQGGQPSGLQSQISALPEREDAEKEGGTDTYGDS